MITIEQIQERLSDAIKQSGLTQKAIAEKLNTSQQSISHYIKGERVPTLDTFANLCVVLDVDPSDILCVKP